MSQVHNTQDIQSQSNKLALTYLYLVQTGADTLWTGGATGSWPQKPADLVVKLANNRGNRGHIQR